MRSVGPLFGRPLFGRIAWAPAAFAVVACAAPHPDGGGGRGAPGAASAAAIAEATVARPADSAVAPTDPTGSASGARRNAVIAVPRSAGAITPTGKFRIGVWAGAPSTGTLLDATGHGAVPVSEARLLWSEGMLYVFFYAGDLDLQARVTKRDGPVWNDDSVAFALEGPDGKKRVIQVSVTGVVTDGLCPGDAAGLADPRCDLGWESGVRAATDYDGTLNRIDDRDEEWAVEAAIPLASLGPATPTAGSTVPFSVSRCEMAHDGPRACGSWSGTLRFEAKP
jgi:hypothetical protein